MDSTGICRACGQQKDTIPPRQNRCRDCLNAYRRQYHRRLSPEKRLATKFYAAKQNYGVDRATVERLFAEQDGKCAICKEPLVLTGQMTYNVDHDHASGLVRGLLCHGCNLGIGNMHDDAATVGNAYAYLLAWEKRLAEDAS